MMKLFLLVAGVFLFPVALSYGVDPAVTIPKFMNFTVEGTDQTHIFRALMGLYLGMVTFCIIAAFTPEWRHVAVIWAVFLTDLMRRRMSRVLGILGKSFQFSVISFQWVKSAISSRWGLKTEN